MDFAPASLSDPEGKLALFGPEHGLLLPPEVTCAAHPPIRNLQAYPFRDMQDSVEPIKQCIVYPVPQHWPVELTEAEARMVRQLGWAIPASMVVPDARVAQLLGWQPCWGPRVSQINPRELEELGWHWQDEPQGVLNDFLKLAQDPITPQTCAAVQAFVQLYGPLWLCRNREHQDCHWSPTGHVGQSMSPCLWAPVEEVHEFVRKAWQARVVVEVGAAWRHTQPAPKSLWPYLRWVLSPHTTVLPAPYEQDVAMHRQVVMQLVNRYLAGLDGVQGGPRLWLLLDQNGQPSLRLYSGLGFLSTVWMEIAQALCDRHGFLPCDDCKRFYLRAGRRPQAGRKQYCPECREKGPKRQWWHTHRGRHHQQA